MIVVVEVISARNKITPDKTENKKCFRNEYKYVKKNNVVKKTSII